jgi:hypothetical protein
MDRLISGALVLLLTVTGGIMIRFMKDSTHSKNIEQKEVICYVGNFFVKYRNATNFRVIDGIFYFTNQDNGDVILTNMSCEAATIIKKKKEK